MILNIVLSIGLCFIIGLGGLYLSPHFGRVLGSLIRAISLGAGFLWAHYQLSGIPPWPPHGSNESLFYIAALSPLLALFYAPRAVWPALLSYLVSLAVLLPFVKQDWLWAQPTLMSCTLFGILWWRSIQRGLGELPSLTLLIISASFLSLGIHMLLNASALLGLLSIACSSLAISINMPTVLYS